MGFTVITYEEAREKMQPGDVIAFSGKGNVSEVIKLFTKSEVSHVGVVYKTKQINDSDPNRYINTLMESTSLEGFSGVIMTRLSDRIRDYDGNLWWLPLSQVSRSNLNVTKFFDFLVKQEGKAYDTKQAIKSALDALDNTPFLRGTTYNKEDFSKFFCSELVAAALEEAGVINNVNASEVTPIDLCNFNIYDTTYYQLKGADTLIKGFNCVKPDGWGC
ncbi:hypothetical protein [Geotalea sp. SG265]|uniref:hypothetical protein n=1 Tax=Geotalea sp. SG265 TaxID=2922867 RepID=UPI001FAF341E|nr:hypothetical protein [Geotalea sp. SG265]